MKWKIKLKSLLKERRQIVQDRNDLDGQWKDLNREILGVLTKYKKTNARIGDEVVRQVTPQKVTWNEKRIIKWYKKHGMRPPLKKVFDPALLEADIKDNKVPAKMLEKFADVEDMTTYVRVDNAK